MPLLLSTLKMKFAGSSETLVFIYQTTWPHIPENCNLDMQYQYSVPQLSCDF
jgi:hypothetical protein